jgi:hypothetical protein
MVPVTQPRMLPFPTMLRLACNMQAQQL